MNILPQPETDATSDSAYYGVIPRPVRHCKALPPAAKLLFSELTALTKREGYCWASNAYFQELYGVERYTVQRWISALVKEGFIRVEILNESHRRIYISEIVPPQKRDGGATKMRQTRNKKEAGEPQKRGPEWYNELKEEKEKESYAQGSRFVGPGPVPARELVGQKDAASPDVKNEMASPSSTVKSKSENGPSASRVRNVQRAVSLTGSAQSREWFEKMWDALHGAGLAGAWGGAVAHVQMLPNRPKMAPTDLAAEFLGYCSAQLREAP